MAEEEIPLDDIKAAKPKPWPEADRWARGKGGQKNFKRVLEKVDKIEQGKEIPDLKVVPNPEDSTTKPPTAS